MNHFKILLLIVGFLFSVEAGVAQSNAAMAQPDAELAQPSKKEQRKIDRAEKKRLKKEERQRRHEVVQSLVEDQTFVLEASTIYGRYMTPFQVSPNINFIKVAGDQITLQTANNFSFGYNGLGGITINGTITDYEVRTSGKRNNRSVLIQFRSPVFGHSTLNLDIQGSNSSRATFIDNWGRRLTFQGEIESLENSQVFEGTPVI